MNDTIIQRIIHQDEAFTLPRTFSDQRHHGGLHGHCDPDSDVQISGDYAFVADGKYGSEIIRKVTP